MKKTFMNEHEITCCIDANDNLCGILIIDENTVIDFDKMDIFVDSKMQNISSSNMRVLEALILNSPRIVTYDSLKSCYYLDYDDCGPALETDTRTQVLRNAIHTLKRYVDIRNRRNEGYFVELDKKISKFHDVKKRDIRDVTELFFSRGLIDSEVTTEVTGVEDALNFSKKFFHSGAMEFADKDGAECLERLSLLSTVFNPITHLDDNDINNNTDVLTEAYNCIVEECKIKGNKEILKIRGPLGSYKNRIMQYLYLSVLKNNNDIIPFFIDIALYEKMSASNPHMSEDEIVEHFIEDFTVLKTAISSAEDKTVLLMIEGIRDFSKGDETLYYNISKKLRTLDCKLVVCIDAEFTVNKLHQFKIHPLASNNFRHYMRITSMSMYRRNVCVDFIKACIDISGITLPVEKSADKIYDRLESLKFSSIDAYWLVYILKNNSVEFFDEETSLSDLFESICLDALGKPWLVDSAAELAYNFEFGTIDFHKANPLSDNRWQLIRTHRSVLDYLIAKHYVRKIRGLNFDKNKHDDNVEKLGFFNMVLQKSITKFVVDMISGDDDCEYNIMIIAERYYKKLTLFGKSELTFWMARLKNSARKFRCVKLLKDFNKTEIELYNTTKFNNEAEKRNLAFLIRGISVSLLYEGDPLAFRSYILSLLEDKTANEVNRGFHLEYYGDKPYIANKTLLDFKDDVTKGTNTLDILCISLDKRKRSRDKSSYVAVLELMTLCNLIQARCEASDNKDVLDVRPYISRTLGYLEWIVSHEAVSGFNEALHYFYWMHDELSNLIKNKSEGLSYSHASVYNKFSEAKKVSRTGWVNEGIPRPENIVEHMYNCWFIGMLYLPASTDDETYSKDKILKILLIHDLAETETGDIPRPEKNKQKKKYDCRENLVMQSLLLSGTYPGAADIHEYLKNWNEWEANESINFRIAKDIDNIQTMHQFCMYYLDNPGKFSVEKICYWLKDIEKIQTEAGKNIASKIILNNPLFKDIILQYEFESQD